MVVLETAPAQGGTPGTRRTAVSDAGGYYQFDDLAPGKYQLQIKVPKGYLPATDTLLSVTAKLHQIVPADFELRQAASVLYLPLVIRR